MQCVLFFFSPAIHSPLFVTFKGGRFRRTYKRDLPAGYVSYVLDSGCINEDLSLR